ncbi:hypothetical protein M569_05636 [Genlisea aurea]|uniref:Uncharacterized protein n=1 Tax=Genlisea aurea TaxID=192259 RepID=S8E9G5_9LAMI|nr:hypothetical protein M569_05636 [Genlisea aurea]
MEKDELRVASFSCYLETTKNAPLKAKEDNGVTKEPPIILANIIPSLRRSRVRKPRRRILNGFGCHSPCFDKKAVHIDDIVARTFPLKQQQQQKQPEQQHDDEIEKETAQQPVKISVQEECETKDSNETPSSPNSCDDLRSEASSDLFEIEDISRGFPLYSQHHRQFCCEDNASDCGSSQASVQWSVVTTSTEDERRCGGDDGGKKKGKYLHHINGNAGGTGLLNIGGCKNRKSVDVAENVCIKIKVSR